MGRKKIGMFERRKERRKERKGGRWKVGRIWICKDR